MHPILVLENVGGEATVLTAAPRYKAIIIPIVTPMFVEK
jgi:hypothetical protein